jgi:DNA-binding CsgD family transcriptional regulator
MTAVVTLRFDEARAPFAESLALYRELEDTWGLARVLHYSGEMARFGGDDERARALYEESLALYQELGHQFSAAIVLHNLGYVAQHQGDQRRALTCFAEALSRHIEHGDRTNIGHCLAGIAGMIGPLGHPEQAARLFGAAAKILETVGVAIWPVDRVDYDANLAAVRDLLRDEAFATAFTAGQELTLQQAIAEAFSAREAVETSTERGDAASGGAIPAAAAAFGLTPRELEVLRLMARRATDREIADALSISPRTVMHHVSHILSKIGAENRRDAAAWATQHNIA